MAPILIINPESIFSFNYTFKSPTEGGKLQINSENTKSEVRLHREMIHLHIYLMKVPGEKMKFEMLMSKMVPEFFAAVGFLDGNGH